MAAVLFFGNEIGKNLSKFPVRYKNQIFAI